LDIGEEAGAFFILAKGIWLFKLDQINADPEGLAHYREQGGICMLDFFRFYIKSQAGLQAHNSLPHKTSISDDYFSASCFSHISTRLFPYFQGGRAYGILHREFSHSLEPSFNTPPPVLSSFL
jgi:hypothetical protein